MRPFTNLLLELCDCFGHRLVSFQTEQHPLSLHFAFLASFVFGDRLVNLVRVTGSVFPPGRQGSMWDTLAEYPHRTSLAVDNRRAPRPEFDAHVCTHHSHR